MALLYPVNVMFHNIVVLLVARALRVVKKNIQITKKNTNAVVKHATFSIVVLVHANLDFLINKKHAALPCNLLIIWNRNATFKQMGNVY